MSQPNLQTLILAGAVCLLSAAASGQPTPQANMLYFDARTHAFGHEPARLTFYNARDAVSLQVRRAHFGEQFTFKVDEKAVAEVGPEVRGLEEAAGLIKGIPGVAPAKGVVPFEEVQIAEVADVTAAVARLQTWPDADTLRIELEAEKKRLADGLESLEEDFAKYGRGICAMTVQLVGVALSCSPPVPGEVDQLETKIVGVANEIRVAGQSAAPNPACKPERTKSFSANPADPYRDSDQFNCFVTQTNTLLSTTKSLRAAIKLPPIGSAAADLQSRAGELRRRFLFYQRKVALVAAGVSVVEAMLLQEEKGKTTSLTTEARLARIKRLKETYGNVLTAEELQKIVGAFTFPSGIERDHLKEVLQTLKGFATPSSAVQTELSTQLKKVEQVKSSAREIDEQFGQRVKALNGKLRDEILLLYELYGRSERNDVVKTLGPWTTNHVVTIQVFGKDTFTKPDLSKLEETIELPAPSGAVTSSTPTSGGAETPPQPPLLGSTHFEVHKTYRFDISGGALFSSVGERDFGIRSVPRLDANGRPILDSQGNPITDLKLVETGRDDFRTDFPIFFTTYLGAPLDVFPGGNALKFHYGVAVGFSAADPSNNIYLGGVIQPTIGIQLIAGLHVGRRNAPQEGIMPGVTVLPPGTTVVPIRKEWREGIFGTIAFDVHIFKKLFGGS